MKRKQFTKTVTIVMSDSIHQQIKTLTNQLDMSTSQWIRDAIAMKLKSQGEQPSDTQKQLTLKNDGTENEYHADN